MHKILVRAQQLQVTSMFFLPKHVFSQMGAIWKIGRSSDRGNSSRGDARLFYFYDLSETDGFAAHGRFMTFRTFFEIFDEK